MTDWRDEVLGTVRTTDGDELQFRIGSESGDVFAEDEDFDGITLTIECRDVERGVAMIAMLGGLVTVRTTEPDA